VRWDPPEDPLHAFNEDRSHWIGVPDPYPDADAVLRALRQRQPCPQIVELRFAGRHAATMLLREDGLHALPVDGALEDVAVVTSPPRGDLHGERSRLLSPPRPGRRQRWLFLHRDQIRDAELGVVGVGRLDERLERLLRDRMLLRMFPGGAP
jgi:hypothetical protein